MVPRVVGIAAWRSGGVAGGKSECPPASGAGGGVRNRDTWTARVQRSENSRIANRHCAQLRHGRIEPLLVDKDPDNFVFTAPRGGPVRANNFRGRVFNPAVERLGIPDLVPHDLRDTAASLAISAGVHQGRPANALGMLRRRSPSISTEAFSRRTWKLWPIRSRSDTAERLTASKRFRPWLR